MEPIINGVKISLKFVRSSNEKIIMIGPPDLAKKANYKEPKTIFQVQLHGFSVLVRRPLVSESLFAQHTRELKTKPAQYLYTQTNCVWSIIPIGVTTFMTPDLFNTSQALPSKIFFVFYDQDRLQGKITKNIHYYEKPKELESVGLYLDSQPVASFCVPQCDTFSNGLGDFLYNQLFQVTQSYYGLNPPNISFTHFMLDSFILAYDLSASNFTNSDSLPLLSSGSLRLRLGFKKATDKVLHLLAFGLSPALMTIDQHKNVSLSSHTV